MVRPSLPCIVTHFESDRLAHLHTVNSRSITVAEHAKQDFSLGSYHKEIATFLLEAAEDANISDQMLIKV